MSEPTPARAPAPTPVPTSKGIGAKPLIGLVIGILAVVFVFQNTGKGRINFLFWSMTMPAWVWLLIVFIAGVIVGALVPALRARKKRRAAIPPSSRT